MARGATRFRQLDVTRAIRATRAAGVEHFKVMIDPATGKIVIVVDKMDELTAEVDSSEWDSVENL